MIRDSRFFRVTSRNTFATTLRRIEMIYKTFLLGFCVGSAMLAATIAAPYSANYTIVDLGAVPGVPAPYGGLTVKAGDNNTLLIGGAANSSGGIYAEGLSRNASGHIIGFTGTASLFSTAPNIDGGLAYAPNGMLMYTAYPTNAVGEIKPGSSSPDQIVPLAAGLSSVGTLAFVPAGYSGAGNFVLATYSTSVYCTAPLSPTGTGTYTIGACSNTVSGSGGPEGIVYVPLGSANFGSPSMLVSEYGASRVSAYQVDANGLPVLASRTDFITGLSGAEGAAIDPVTGDFLFSTFGGGNHLYAITGFVAPVSETPEPGTTLLLVSGLALFGLGRLGRKKA
jgi:hypothetical protein